MIQRETRRMQNHISRLRTFDVPLRPDQRRRTETHQQKRAVPSRTLKPESRRMTGVNINQMRTDQQSHYNGFLHHIKRFFYLQGILYHVY